MPDNPMKKDDDQDERRESPGQTHPTQPDKGNERVDKDRKASDQDDMKKHSPSPNNPNNPNR